MEKNPEFLQPLTIKEKAALLERAKKKATDERPVWVYLENPNLLPWAGMGGLVPQKGILVGVTYNKRRGERIPQGIVLDFTRVIPIIELSYASLPLSAVEINKATNEVRVDCTKAVETGVGIPFNQFIERSQN